MDTLGFVGLGHMGGNMAARFLTAGYTVLGESIDRRDAQGLVDQGLDWRDTPREVAEAADVVLRPCPTTTCSRVSPPVLTGSSPGSPTERSGST
jgi:3-hydroxyisobutyrate dehydrogenase-like beta-hydroxyacid dehydrogenase